MKDKITFLVKVDYANVLTEYSNIINKHSLKYESRVIGENPHRFGYTLQHDYNLSNPNDIKKSIEWVNDSKYIIFSEESGHGEYNTLKTMINRLNINLEGKHLCVWHPGTHYRNSYQRFNNNPLTSKMFKRIYMVDLYRLSPKSEKDVVLLPFMNFNIDEELYIENMMDKINSNNKIILHCPSDPNRKGTSIITKTLNELNKEKFSFITHTKKPHPFIMSEKKKSLFYIDQFNIEAGFGVSSIESLICGNVTLSSTSNAIPGLTKYNPDLKCPIINLGTVHTTLRDGINEVMNYDKNSLINICENNLKYLKECYNGINVINYIEEKILKDG